MSEKPRLPVADADLHGKEREYLLKAFDSGRISGSGEFVDRFEHDFARFCGTECAVACANGTVALHLALLALDIGPGDEVIVPALTYVATANAVRYCGATPVFADCDVDTWNISESTVAPLITNRTRAIVVVHLFGNPVDLAPISEMARKHGLWVIEDAAQAHGATYRSMPVGSLGHIATFSFYGNKILTTGEGGMVTTNNPDLAGKLRLLRGQGMDPARRYWFPVIGYNYRLTNLQAAIGTAQLERADELIASRRRLASWYNEAVADIQGAKVQRETPEARSAWWLFGLVFEDVATRDYVARSLEIVGIETRPFFPALNTLPPYASVQPGAGGCPESLRLGNCGLNLPSGSHIEQTHVREIVNHIRRNLESRRPSPKGATQ